MNIYLPRISGVCAVVVAPNGKEAIRLLSEHRELDRSQNSAMDILGTSRPGVPAGVYMIGEVIGAVPALKV